MLGIKKVVLIKSGLFLMALYFVFDGLIHILDY